MMAQGVNLDRFAVMRGLAAPMAHMAAVGLALAGALFRPGVIDVRGGPACPGKPGWPPGGCIPKNCLLFAALGHLLVRQCGLQPL